MPKKNGFCLFMEERRPLLEATGHSVPGGRKDLAQLVSDDWKALPEQEKERYKTRAKQYHDRLKTEKTKYAEAIVRVEKPLTKTSSYATTLDKYLSKDEMTMRAARDLVFKIFKIDEWKTHPIVICSFTLLNEPESSDDLYLPAEMGLTAMSVENGVIDNYARIVHPRSVPKGYEEEVALMAKKLGIPAPGRVPDFVELRSIMMIIQSFLEKYHGDVETKKNELHLFTLDSDFITVNRCLEWLFEASKYPRFPVKVLSLNLFAYLASSAHTRKALCSESKLMEDSALCAPTAGSFLTTVSSRRTVGKPLVSTFIYPEGHPLISFGLFVSEQEVEDVIKMMDNYKYYEEISCVYHLKAATESQNCALNMTNRYAFSLLEILTMSNDVPILPGSHYPLIDKPNMEKAKRFSWLRNWGFTHFEEEMAWVMGSFEQKLGTPLRVEKKGKERKEEVQSTESEWDPRGHFNPYHGAVPSIFRGYASSGHHH